MTKEISIPQYQHQGKVRVDGEVIYVDYYFSDADTIECRSLSGHKFSTSYKSLISEDGKGE